MQMQLQRSKRMRFLDSVEIFDLKAMEPANPKVLASRTKLKLLISPKSFFQIPSGLDRLGHPDIPYSQIARHMFKINIFSVIQNKYC